MIERTQWVRALTAVSESVLSACLARLTEGWSVTPCTVPRSGLGMLKLKDGAFEQPFYLGEFAFSSVYLSVTLPNGLTAEGAAQVMDDRLEYAECLALCDAVLSARLPGWEALNELLELGMAQRHKQQRQRQCLLADTRVDFSMLDAVGEDDADA